MRKVLILVAVMIALFLDCPVFAQVVLDASGTGNGSMGNVTTFDYTGLTVGSGSNRVLVVTVSWSADPGAITVKNWDQTGTPQSLGTAIVDATGTSSPPAAQHIQIYCLAAPTSGNKTLRLTWTNSVEIGMNAISFTGADQTGGTTTCPNSSSASGSNGVTATVTITIPTNGFGISINAGGSNAAVNSCSATQHFIYHGAGTLESCGSRSSSSGTFTATFAGNEDWVIGATGIAQSAGGGGATSEASKKKKLQAFGIQ